MDFEEVCEFFGGTFFYEDLRGNLQEIKKKLDKYQNESPTPSIDHTATLILLRAIWSLLSGDFKNASSLLNCLTNSDIYGERWKYRDHAYSALMYTWQKHPPLFAFSELSGPAMLTWELQFEPSRAFSSLDYCLKRW
jgi:hypothetical protein